MGSLFAIAVLFLIGYFILVTFKNSGLKRNTNNYGNAYFDNNVDNNYLPQSDDANDISADNGNDCDSDDGSDCGGDADSGSDD